MEGEKCTHTGCSERWVNNIEASMYYQKGCWVFGPGWVPPLGNNGRGYCRCVSLGSLSVCRLCHHSFFCALCWGTDKLEGQASVDAP